MFDVDGVLADFSGGYRRVERGLGKPETRSDRWDDYLDDAVWDAIKQAPRFWATLDPLVGRNEFERIGDLGHYADVYFVTARVGVAVKDQTTRWLTSHCVCEPTVVISSRKGEIAAAIKATHTIDDKIGNAVAVSYLSRTTKSCLLNIPRGRGTAHNQVDHDVIGGSVRRVESVDHFIDEVNR